MTKKSVNKGSGFLSWQRLTIFMGLLMLVKIIYTGELAFLIHPRYFWLVYVGAAVLAGVILFDRQQRKSSAFFVMVMLILNTFFVGGLMINFQPLTSFAQEQKIVGGGALSSVDYSRSKRITLFGADTESRTLGDWVRAFSVNPEPTKYDGQAAKIVGFYYVNDQSQPMIARYALNCCAADARIIGIRLAQDLELAPNTWFEVSGTMKAAELNGERFVQLDVVETELIPTPDNPYVTN